MAFTKAHQIETATLNITSNPQDEETLHTLIDHVGLFRKDIEAQFNHKLLRLSKEKVKIACQVVGCKPVLAASLSDKTFETFLEKIESECPALSPGDKAKYYIYTTKTRFLEIFRAELEKRNLTKDRNIFDFELALGLIEQSQSMIVLLGGTSGSGKSTIASVLASRFGIPTILSTDSIRHVMRNFMSAEECPILFCSTYEAGSKIKCDEDVKENKRIVMGFQQQAAKVQERLEHILKDFYDRGESIVVEGVHLTPDFLTAMLKKFDNCIPFLIYISNESKHRERFAVRSKYMTLEKRHNKYVENFGNIRQIQKHLTKKAEEYLIPKLDNSNVDKSVGIIHRTLVRCLRRVAKGESLYDPENKNALKIYEQFNKVTKNIWSSEAVKKYIHSKSKKTYKNEIFKRFFQQNAKPLPKEVYDKIEPEVRQNLLGEIGLPENRNPKGDSQFPTKLKAFKEDFILLDAQDNQLKHFKSEDQVRQEKSPEDSQQYPESPVRRASDKFEEAIDMQTIIGRGKSFEEGDQVRMERQESEENAIMSKSQENLKILTNRVNRPGDPVKTFKIKSEEVKFEEGVPQGISPSLPNRPVLRLNLLEEALANKRVLTLKGFTQGNVRSLKKFVECYNLKHLDYYLKMFQESQRIIIQKRRKTEKDVSPMLPNSESNSRERGSRVQGRFSLRRYDDYNHEKTPKGRYGDMNTSEDNIEGSDEESSPSVTSQEKWSTVTGNLDVNLHMLKRGSTHYMSDQLDVSDDVESKNDGEDETSLEVLQSGNSISEQSIEEDEDEDEEISVKPLKMAPDQTLVAK